jgi:hypothetical protein
MATQTTFDDIVNHLRISGFQFGIGSGNRLALSVSGKHAVLDVQIYYPWEKEIIVLYAVCPLTVTKNHGGEMLELAARINWGLLFATCEVAPDTGSIRFRATMPVDESPFHREQFDTLLATVCSLADHYYPALAMVIEKGVAPAEAVAAVECDY